MPLYEYICLKCGFEFEKMCKISDPPLKRCPECNGKVEKKISRTAFQLKGEGWYKDGYNKPSAAPPKPATTEKKADGQTQPSKNSAAKKAE